MKIWKTSVRTLIACALSGCLSVANAQDKPNVVLMVADNVGYGDIGAFQGGEIRGMPTPRIDQLASEGLTLTQFLTEPGCTPSRAALLTGRYAHRAGLGSIVVVGTPNTLRDEEVTIAELFKSVGYNTAITGKWHVGQEDQSRPVNQGFDEYRVGVLNSSDGAYYRGHMERTGLPEELIANTAPKIWEGDSRNGMRVVREYTVDYRAQVEADITEASIDFINELSGDSEPFFLYVGFTHTHYPNRAAPEFTGKSPAGPYGDMIMELDYRTGEILDAIEAAGIEDNTIVIWLSDDGASPNTGPTQDIGGFNGMWVSDLGDGREGSLRTPAMIKWPGKIKPGKSNEMVSIHDFYTTLGSIAGAEIPTDRAIDGVDQADFFLGEQENSNRESVITFLGDEIAAVRWKHFRIYPKQFIETEGNPAMTGIFGARTETNLYPIIINLFKDPGERHNVTADHAFVVGPYLQIIGAYKRSIDQYPVPKPFSMTEF
ncbi:MAG: sulfatase-like hydrolase/transferase [Woeseiaceae bacterium]